MKSAVPYGLIASVAGLAHTVTNTWESTRDVLQKKENKFVGGSNVSTYEYGVNVIGQRTSVDASGGAFGTEADWNWGYDSLGEVVSAEQTHTSASSRHYSFDAIGNRTEHREGTQTGSGGTATTYTPNTLNQYSTIASPAASLTPVYDLDGNMTSGPIPIAPTVNATFAWDGENRQLSVTPNGGSSTTSLYDAMGRRVAKTTGSTRTYFLYDGWNPVAEYTGAVHTTGTPPALTLVRTHLWGTDLSGSLQGAGGVGGLLGSCLFNGGGSRYYPTYDGNGNVSEYLVGTTVVAHYEYDPFGNDITPAAKRGKLHNSFPFRFSTKYQDAESGQYSYGMREYNQWLGRWNNHDPIEENGGLNLYGFAKNAPVSNIDVLGLLVPWLQDYITTFDLEPGKSYVVVPGYESSPSLTFANTRAVTTMEWDIHVECCPTKQGADSHKLVYVGVAFHIHTRFLPIGQYKSTASLNSAINAEHDHQKDFSVWGFKEGSAIVEKYNQEKAHELFGTLTQCVERTRKMLQERLQPNARKALDASIKFWDHPNPQFNNKTPHEAND